MVKTPLIGLLGSGHLFTEATLVEIIKQDEQTRKKRKGGEKNAYVDMCNSIC